MAEANNEVFLCAFEGVFAGIIQICKEFKFNEYSVISKLDAKRLCKMVSKVSAIDYLRRDDIPEDITYQEAALMSLIIGVKLFNSCLENYFKSPTKKFESLEAGFKEATILIGQIQNNILKCISLEIVNEGFEKNGQDIAVFINDCKTIFEGRCFSLDLWSQIFKAFYRTDKLKPAAEETYKTILERFDFAFVKLNDQEEEKSILAGLLYNSFRLKEVDPDASPPPENLWITMMTSPESLKPMLKLELSLLEYANHYSTPKTKDLFQRLAGDLEYCFKGRSLLNNEDETKKSCFEKEEKLLFRTILDFLKKLAQSQVPQRNGKVLMKENLNAVFGFFGDFYKIYSNYTKEKITSLDTKIEELKNKNQKVEEGEALEEKKEGEVAKEAEEGLVREIDKLEKEKVKLMENYKNEVQKYIDAVIQCQQHYLVNLKELFGLGEEFNSVNRDYWIKLYQGAAGNLTTYLMNYVLKEKVTNIERPDNQINLKDVSKYKSINQIYQIDFLYQCLEQVFIKEIVNELSLSKGLIEGLLMATKETLSRLASEDLVLFAKEKECLDFPDTLGGFISRISKLMMNYIVSQVLENNCQLNGDNSFLLMSLDLTESVLTSQQCILHNMRRDIFSGSNTCFRDTIYLMNTILRANKGLRVEFMNRNLLAKLLTVNGLSVLDNDETSSVLFLMMTLLEDCFVLDSQVDLVLKCIRQKQESQEISLEDLMKDKNFRSLQNYKQVLEKLKLYGIKSNVEKDLSLPLPDLGKDHKLIENLLQKNLSPVAEECLKILLKSLLENYSFEKTSMASFEKVKDQEKAKKIEDLNKRRIFTKGYLFAKEGLQEEEWSDDSNVYWDESLKRQMILKGTSALVVVLSGILSTNPHLIPSVIFQEFSVEGLLSDDSDFMGFFKPNSRWSILDILLRLVLLKDGSSAVFMIASLIEDNVVTTVKEQQSIELKYILLIKTFEIIEDILKCEESQNQAFENLSSVLMRRNIAMIIAFIVNEMNKDDGSSLGSHKGEILQLIMQTTKKLFSNPQMIAYSIQGSEPNNSMIRILSSTMKQNAFKSMTREEIKSNYAGILRVLKTRDCYKPKVFQVDLKQTFDKYLPMREESKNNQVHPEDQKKFEMWEEKSQWEREETKRVLELAGLKEKELVSEVRLAVHSDTPLGADLTLNNVLSENLVLNGLESLYKPVEILRGKSLKSGGDLKVDYLLDRLKESYIFGFSQKERDQTFGGNIDSDIFLPLLKADLSKIEKLKEESMNIAKLYLKEQNQDDAQNIQEADSNQEMTKDNKEPKIEEKDITTQEAHVAEDRPNSAPIEEKVNQEDETTFKYFMDVGIKNEANFKSRVNKALKQGRRLKEMICLEKALKGPDEKNEEIVKEFTSKMTEFDKNIVYASLGKKFEVGLSEDSRKITEGARKELEAIQKNFSQYEEAMNKIPKVEEQKQEEEEENKEEDEEYGDLDYDIQFLAEQEKQEGENKDEDAEEGKEDENEFVAEEGTKPESAPAETENKNDNNDKITRLINSFEVGDTFITDALELLFCYINPNSENKNLAIEFLKDSLSLNPINELKIFDVLMTILYTPDFFQHLKRKLADSYEKAVETILDYLSGYFEDASRSYVLFAPKRYLEEFGVAILKEVKEATSFGQKISDCHTVLDMLLGLIGTKSFCNNEQWRLRILGGVSSVIKKEKKIKLAEGAPQVPLDRYRKAISCKKLLNLLSIIEKPTDQDSEAIILEVQELFLNLKSTPELFIPFQDYLSNHFYQTILKLNKEIENSIRSFKQNQDKELEATKIEEILAPLQLSQFKLIMVIMFSFASVFQENLFTEEGKKSKASKKLHKLLRIVTESLFNQEEVKAFFVNIHELADLLNKVQQQDSFNKLFDHLITICIGHYSIIIMESSVQEESVGLRKQTEGSSNSDDDQTPSLAKLVSFEDPETQMIPLQKSYSSYRREVNVDFGAIFANFALKHSSRVAKLMTDRTTGIVAVLGNLISIIIPKCPWIIDFKSKMGVFETQVNEQLEKNGLYTFDRRRIEVDRKNLVFSAMKEFKDRPRKDLLQLLQISYTNESGYDAGGLRRDFYEMITRQLFDPSVGLFKLAGNQISIQPNPFSAIVPYDSTLMQFAGLILAKAICDKMVVDLHFTKPFLKHLLGKKITIADMDGIDADLGKNLRWILENNIEELYLNYTHEIEALGERTVIELKEGGSDLYVEEENKKEYVKQICEYRMTKQIERQLKDFLKGFRMILPRDFISNFTTSELEILIAGESKIDLEEMKKHASIGGHNKTDQVILWLWEVLEEFSPDQLTAFYYFTSGSTKVPFGGFKENPIRIYSNLNKDGLPVAHTCSYAIEIPPYESKDKLREKLLLAIFDGAGEFQIA